MHDLITHHRSARLLLLHLLSLLIFLFPSLSPTASLSTLAPLFHTHTFFSLLLLFSICFKALIICLKLWSSLKGRNRRRAGGEAWDSKTSTITCPSFSPSFVLPSLSIPSSRVSVTPALLSAFLRSPSCFLSLTHPSCAVAGGGSPVV